MKRISQILVLCVLPLSFCGCMDAYRATIGRSVEQAKQKAKGSSYQPFARAFHNFHDAHRRAPGGWSELISFAQQSGDDAATLRRLQSVGVTVHWGIGFREATIGSSNFVLLYDSQALTQGGPVLLMDGTVMMLDSSSLQEKLRAQADIKPRAARSPTPDRHLSAAALRSRASAKPPSNYRSSPQPTFNSPMGGPYSQIQADMMSGAIRGGPHSPGARMSPPSRPARDISSRSQTSVEAEPGIPVTGETALKSADRAKEWTPSTEKVFGLRTWTDTSGKFKTRARLVDYAGGQITIRRQDGKQITLPLSRISVADQRYVLEHWVSE